MDYRRLIEDKEYGIIALWEMRKETKEDWNRIEDDSDSANTPTHFIGGSYNE